VVPSRGDRSGVQNVRPDHDSQACGVLHSDRAAGAAGGRVRDHRLCAQAVGRECLHGPLFCGGDTRGQRRRLGPLRAVCQYLTVVGMPKKATPP
jgi:hypothetical protein